MLITGITGILSNKTLTHSDVQKLLIHSQHFHVTILYLLHTSTCVAEGVHVRVSSVRALLNPLAATAKHIITSFGVGRSYICFILLRCDMFNQL